MKKLKGLIIMLMICLGLFGLTACENNTKATLGYEQITAEAAKQLMDTENDYVIIDARTKEEFYEGHIENALLIPYDEIGQRATEQLPDKSQLILVYCRSGRRSKLACESLVSLGYTNVKEFGGIIDWQYDTVK